MMNRRDLLRRSALWGLSVALGPLSACAHKPPMSPEEKELLRGIRLVDAHAHPDWVKLFPQSRDASSTLDSMKAVGMAASSFSAVGDHVFLNPGRGGLEYQNTRSVLDWWKSGARTGKIRVVLKTQDIPEASGPGQPPGAILAIEGGDPLEGKAERVDEFYHLGVRMITVVHYRNNELGDTMRARRDSNPGPPNHGLTAAGRKVVERMQTLGIVVDVAHSDKKTLEQIVKISGKPLVDSHTSVCPFDDPSQCGRLRPWQEMEWVAKTGGVVCTWPLAYRRGETVRETFRDWALEILEMKKRVGMDHVGLGTDGGGNLPQLIQGYRDLRDLVYLISAMKEVGLSNEEIAAYMGGNFYRVLRQCIG